MKNIFIPVLILFVTSGLYAATLTLQSRVVVGDGPVLVRDITESPVDIYTGDVILLQAVEKSVTLTASEVIARLHEAGIFEVILLGDEVFLYKNDRADDVELSDDEFIENDRQIEQISLKSEAVKILLQSLATYVDTKRYELDIEIVGIEPELDLNQVTDSFTWTLPAFRFGLKDITALKRLKLNCNDTTYSVKVAVHCYADIFLADRNMLKGDHCQPLLFTRSHVDISAFHELETLVLDINDAVNTRFKRAVRNGEALRWTTLERKPLIEKGERITYRYERGQIHVELFCIALDNGFENEKIEIELDNGTKHYGIIRRRQGTYYVEVL